MALRVNKNSQRTDTVKTEADSRHKTEAVQRGFSMALSKEAGQQTRQHLEELLGKIEQQGKKLGQTPTFSELKSYRDLVKKFMAEAVGQMYDVDAGAGWDRRGRQKSYTFAAQAVLGSAKMVLETGKHPGELKDAVTSPGGTTIAGLAALEEMGFRGTVMEGIHAAIMKAIDMSK